MPTQNIDLPVVPLWRQADQEVDLSQATGWVEIDPELSYCLDCAVQLGEISPVDYVLFTHDTPPARALQSQRDHDATWSAHWLRNTARAFFDQLTLEERYVVVMHAIGMLEFGVDNLLDRMEFVVQQQCLRDMGITENFPRLIRDHDPELLSAIPAKVFEDVPDVTRDRVQQFAQPLFAEAVSRLEADIELTREALIWVSDPEAQARAKTIAHKLLHAQQSRPLPRVRVGCLTGPAEAVAQRKKVQAAKAAIKKAMKLLSRFGAEENTRLLVSGEEVRISHPASPFEFRLKAHKHRGWLIDRTHFPGGHVPYQLALYAKDGLHLANLCVVFQNTPVLDQLLALTMFVQTGDEMALLEKANWFGVAERARALQYLQDQAPALVTKLRPPVVDGCIRLDRDEDVFWEPYRGPVRSWLGEIFLPARDMLSRIQQSLTASTAPLALA